MTRMGRGLITAWIARAMVGATVIVYTLGVAERPFRGQSVINGQMQARNDEAWALSAAAVRTPGGRHIIKTSIPM